MDGLAFVPAAYVPPTVAPISGGGSYVYAYNPTGTVAALTYHAAHEIVTRYLKNPGPLVQA